MAYNKFLLVKPFVNSEVFYMNTSFHFYRVHVHLRDLENRRNKEGKVLPITNKQ
jgi:hypothetical protein